MGDDMEHRVTKLETTLPFIQKAIEATNEQMRNFHQESVAGRTAVNNKLDSICQKIEARENQLLGGWFVGKKLLGLVAVVATAGSAAGSKLAVFLAKVF